MKVQKNLAPSLKIVQNKKILVSITLLVLIFLIIYHRWLNFSLFASGDFSFFFPKTMQGWLSPSIWSVDYFGSVDLLSWKTYYTLLNGVFGILGFSSQVAEKFLVMWPWIILPVVSSFLLVKEATKSTLAAFVGSLVFSLNTYFLSINTQGHILLSLAAAYGVLALWFLIRSIDEKKVLLSLLGSLFLFTSGFYDFRFLYITILFFLLYGVYLFIVDGEQNWRNILRLVFFVSLPTLVVGLLNSHYLFSLFKLGLLTDNSILSRVLFGDEFWNILRSTTLFFPFWNGAEPSWFIVQPTPFYFWLIPLFAFLGLLVNRKNKKVLFFGLVSLIGILLTKQTGRPFPNLYPWLQRYLPGFAAFREASKFYFLIAMAYAVLIGALTAWLWKNYRKIWLQKFITYSLTFLVAIIFLWNAKPIITGKINSLFVPCRMPSDYLIVKDFISNQPGYFRTLWIPEISRWGFYEDLHPKVNASHLEISMGLEGKENNSLTGQEKVIQLLKQNSSSGYLNMSAIKYIFVPLQDKKNDDAYTVNEYDRQFFINELDKLRYLARKDIGTREVIVYENKDYRPHIYLTYEKETPSNTNNIPIQTIDFRPNSASEYKIYIKNLLGPVYLNFSESYHDGWKLSLGDMNWLQALVGREYFLPDSFHYRNEAGFNSFLLDPSIIKEIGEKTAVSNNKMYSGVPKKGEVVNSHFTENADGSINLELVLYFKPQSYFYFGLTISSITLLLLIGSILFLLSKRQIFVKLRLGNNL